MGPKGQKRTIFSNRGIYLKYMLLLDVSCNLQGNHEENNLKICKKENEERIKIYTKKLT